MENLAACLLILCCSFGLSCGDVVYDDGNYTDYYVAATEPMYHNIWANSAVMSTAFDRCDIYNGIGSDGLMCWNEAWVDNATERNNYFSFCPTIANQFNLEITANAKVDKVMGDVQFDYSDCGFDFDSLTPKDKQTLKDVTIELMKMQVICRSSSALDTESVTFRVGRVREFRGSNRPKTIFDNAGCSTLEDGVHVMYNQCPIDSRYFKSTSYIGYGGGLSNYTKHSLTDDGYSLGWNCFKDEVKDLLKRVRVDRYFKPGCAAFKDDQINLPYTRLGEEVQLKCKKSKSTDLIDESQSVTFKCSNYAEWQGNRNMAQRRECISKDAEILLSLTKDNRCPAESDGIVQWSEARSGRTESERCPRHFLGYDTELDLCNMIDWDAEDYYSDKNCDMYNYRYKSVTRQCSDSGEWLAPDYNECLNALPNVLSKAYRNLERD